MSLQVRLALEGNLAQFTKDVSAKVAYAARYATETYGRRLQMQLRDDTRAGGLGERVANAWRLRIYNDGPSPVAMVYSKAPLIVTAFSQDTTITPDGHFYLAIPTDNVPRIGGHAMSPREVEARYGQALIFVANRPGAVLAFIKATPDNRASRRRAGQRPEFVLMFVMVSQVRLRKRLSWPELMASAKDDFVEFFGEQIAGALGD